MAVDLNLDMGAIIKGFIAKQGGGMSMPGGLRSNSIIESYKIAIIIFAVVLLISSLYIGTVYIPMKEKNSKKLEELNKIMEMKSQLSVLDSQILALKSKLDKSKEEYIESLAHFGNSEDLGALYQTVSTLASKYNLVVLNVKEVAPPPVKAQPKVKTPEDGKAVPKAGEKGAKVDAKVAATTEPTKPKIAVKEIKVDIEIKGRYGEYIKFKEDLALAEILLKINTESIMVKNEATEQGSIYVKLNLSTYAIDKKPFQGIITDQTNEKAN